MFTYLASAYKSTYSRGLEIKRPEGAPHYVFVYFHSPTLFFPAEGRLPQSNSYILLEPGVSHHYRSAGSLHIDDWLHFTADAAGTAFLKSLPLPLNRLTPCPQYEALKPLLRRLAGDLPCAEAFKGALQDALISTVLSLLSAPQPPGEDTCRSRQHYERFCALREAIYRMPEKKYTVAALAEAAALSASRFAHLYKDFFAAPPVEDIAAARLKRARYLLCNSSLTVSEIAETAGYGDSVQMIRHFNKYLKMSPGQYRRKKG